MISPPLQFGIIIPQERDDPQKSIKKTGELKEAGNGGMLFQAGKGRIQSSRAEGGVTPAALRAPPFTPPSIQTISPLQ
jgi:hypothetical protein